MLSANHFDTSGEQYLAALVSACVFPGYGTALGNGEKFNFLLCHTAPDKPHPLLMSVLLLFVCVPQSSQQKLSPTAWLCGIRHNRILILTGKSFKNIM